ncbi:MAG: hypothetical protein KIT58_12545 [Planctomycetota bacterium]|nr:hypothetical protein [Planctomycetota bacterium]
MTLAGLDHELRSATAAAYQGDGPVWLRPYVERADVACCALVAAEGEAEDAWRFGELLLAADDLRTMVHAWLCEQALMGERE